MRWLRRIVLVLAPVLAAALVVLAVDVLRVPSGFETGDLRLESAPTHSGARWDLDPIVPWRAAARVLETDDDVEYRRTVAVFARVQPGKVPAGDQRLDALRAQAQLELTRTSRAEPDPRRRAQLLNYLGAMMLDRNIQDALERAHVLRTAIDTFRNAVQLDPSNGDAKYNLELVLRLAAVHLANVPGDRPSGERAEGERSGAGRAGSGY